LGFITNPIGSLFDFFNAGTDEQATRVKDVIIERWIIMD